MKKILMTYIVCVMVMFSMVGVFAYASYDNTTLYKSATSDATTNWIGYNFNCHATAKNDSSSSSYLTAAIWGSYKGALWPATKEATSTVYAGKTNSLADAQDMTSIFRLVLTPRFYKGYVSGSGSISLGIG